MKDSGSCDLKGNLNPGVEFVLGGLVGRISRSDLPRDTSTSELIEFLTDSLAKRKREHFKYSSTVCFRDLAKLNLPMVVQF